MGKRELLLLLAFLVLGGVVYQVTAPRATGTTAGRSWTEALRNMRGEMFGSRARFQVDRPVQAHVEPRITKLQLGELAGRIEIVGEDRQDVQGQARVTLFGESEQDVQAAGAALRIEAEAGDDTLTLTVTHPDQWRLTRRGRPGIDFTLRVPMRLAVAVDCVGATEVRQVAGVALGNGRGKAVLRDISGPVTGEYREGNLDVEGAASVDLETRRTTLRLARIDGDVEVDANDGSVRAEGLTHKTSLTTRRAVIEVSDQAGPLDIDGTEGDARVDGLSAPLTFDGTRLPLRLTLVKPVAVNAETTEAPITVDLPAGGVTLDVDMDEGSVRLPDGIPVPAREGSRTKVSAKLGGGGPVVKLTGARATITVKEP